MGRECLALERGQAGEGALQGFAPAFGDREIVGIVAVNALLQALLIAVAHIRLQIERQADREVGLQGRIE